MSGVLRCIQRYFIPVYETTPFIPVPPIDIEIMPLLDRLGDIKPTLHCVCELGAVNLALDEQISVRAFYCRSDRIFDKVRLKRVRSASKNS